MARTARVKYNELNVSVVVGKGDCRKTITYDVSRMKLPATFSCEGLVLEVRQNGKKQNGTHVEPDPDRIKGRGARKSRTVEITLPDKLTADIPTWKKYPLIPVPSEVRPFFPPFGKDFVIVCGGVRITTHVTNANETDTDPMRGRFIRQGVAKIWNANPAVKPGDKLVFDKLPQKQDGLTVYRVTIVSS